MRATLIATLLGILAGCSAASWLPWSRPPAAERVREPVIELVASAPADAAVPVFTQYWHGNTLVLDLQDAGTSGRILLAPKPGGTWPRRLAFRVRPGVFGILEVRGDQRVVVPIALEGAEAVDVQLAPGVYSRATERLDLVWGSRVSSEAQSPGG
jgi:hypothetical protein